jgi:Transposase DDE domain
LEKLQHDAQDARLAAHLAGRGQVRARLCQRQAGRRPKYSEAAIQFCLTIKRLFNLALRQAMGMAQSLLKLAGLDWQVPGFSTVSRGPEAFIGDDRSAADYNRIAPLGRQHGHQDGRRRVKDKKTLESAPPSSIGSPGWARPRLWRWPCRNFAWGLGNYEIC